jgi:hypothetical protein
VRRNEKRREADEKALRNVARKNERNQRDREEKKVDGYNFKHE